nr:MAG TPA: hypothetical protein [Caudoviricetes sp.]DAP75863.1 MAG TPA: hypothetical protein [Caudoviricetes sp.]
MYGIKTEASRLKTMQEKNYMELFKSGFRLGT